MLREIRRAGINTRKVAIVGAEEPGLSLARNILHSTWMVMDIAGAIKLTSKSTVIFKQRRHGISDEGIMVWKFGSMTFSRAGYSV